MVQTVLIKNQLKIIPPIAINSNFPSPQHIYIWSILEGYVAKMIQAIRLGVYHYFHVNLQFVIFYTEGFRPLIRSSVLTVWVGVVKSRRSSYIWAMFQHQGPMYRYKHVLSTGRYWTKYLSDWTNLSEIDLKTTALIIFSAH